MSIRPLKRLGQNFLRDPNTALKIVASLRPSDGARVVEIGPGTGALTKELASRYPGMVAIEVDGRAVEYLQSELPDVDVRHADVLDTDWRALAGERKGPLYVVGNLPYNITTPILFSLLDASDVVEEIVVMVQYEVAQRLAAEPRTKDYGSLTVGVQQHADVKMLFKVSRNVFVPRPAVTSAVVRITVNRDRIGEEKRELIRKVVRAAFGQRRKTLRNSLQSITAELSGGESFFETFDERFASRRAEELTPAEFIELAEMVAAARATA